MASGLGDSTVRPKTGVDYVKRLNGWQRLWVALSVIWLLVVAAFTIALWSSASDYEHRRLDDSIDAVGHYLERENPSYRYEGAWATRTKYNDLSDDQLLARLHDEYKGKVDFQPIETEYRRKLDRLPTERAEAVGVALLVWFVPAAAVYALGLTVAWIRRGFRQANP